MSWRPDLLIAALIGGVLAGAFVAAALGFILTGKKES